MRKLNVLIVPSWFPSKESPVEGVFFEQQIEALKKKGLNVVVILPPDIKNYLNKKNIKKIFEIFDKPVMNKVNYNGNRIYSIEVNGITRINWIHQLFFKNASKKLFNKYLSENSKPDIIHAHAALWGGIFSYYIKKKNNIPYVVSEMMTHYEENRIPLKLFPLLGKVFGNAASRLVVSPQLGKILEDKIGNNAKPWLWIPYSAEDYFFNAIHTEAGDVTKAKFRFLNIGMMEEDDRKGHKVLLSAFAKKFVNDNNAEVVIIGDGPLRKHLEEFALELKISERVIFKGIVTNENLAKEISKCDVFVFPSNIETSGVVVTDALACGKPVIASECNGPE